MPEIAIIEIFEAFLKQFRNGVSCDNNLKNALFEAFKAGLTAASEGATIQDEKKCNDPEEYL